MSTDCEGSVVVDGISLIERGKLQQSVVVVVVWVPYDELREGAGFSSGWCRSRLDAH
jgi:hypothetical protein